MEQKKSAVEVYLSTVFKWGLLILVTACMCATVTLNVEKALGYYQDVPWAGLISFAIMDIVFFLSLIHI